MPSQVSCACGSGSPLFASYQVWKQIHDRMNEGGTYRVKLHSDEVCESKVGVDLGLRKVQFLERTQGEPKRATTEKNTTV